MKMYNSIEESIWTTPNQYPFTEEERALLKTVVTEENTETIDSLKTTIAEYLSANPFGEITESELVILNNLYTENKPELAEGESYSLINAAIFKSQNADGEDVYSGLINCRIATTETVIGEQHQIRF